MSGGVVDIILVGNDLTDDEFYTKMGPYSNNRFTVNKILLSHNALTRFPFTVFDHKNITVLTLGYNNIGSIPECIWTLSNIKWLNIEHNRLSGLPSSLAKLTCLTNLFLNNNQLRWLFDLTKLTKLVEFDFSDNYHLPHRFKKYANIHEKYLDNTIERVNYNSLLSNASIHAERILLARSWYVVALKVGGTYRINRDMRNMIVRILMEKYKK